MVGDFAVGNLSSRFLPVVPQSNGADHQLIVEREPGQEGDLRRQNDSAAAVADQPVRYGLDDVSTVVICCRMSLAHVARPAFSNTSAARASGRGPHLLDTDQVNLRGSSDDLFYGHRP